METNSVLNLRTPWNKGKLTGQKAPLKLKEIWAIRTHLQMKALGLQFGLRIQEELLQKMHTIAEALNARVLVGKGHEGVDLLGVQYSGSP